MVFLLKVIQALKSGASLAKAAKQSLNRLWCVLLGASHRQMLLSDDLRKKSGLLPSDCSSGYVACIYLMSNLTSGLPFFPLFLQTEAML